MSAERPGGSASTSEAAIWHDVECSAYTALYGNHVLEIEYTDNGRSACTTACTARGATLSIIYRDRDVVAKGQPGYHYEYC